MRSLSFLLVTTVLWHASKPSIQLSENSHEVYLEGISLDLPWPMFFHPTGVALKGDMLLLSAAFRLARFELKGRATRLVNELTLPALDIGDLAFSDNGTVALAGRAPRLSPHIWPL